MYREVNSGTNLPAQIDIQAVDGDAYKFLFMAKGGGSANKTSLFQETKALLAPENLLQFLVDKMKHLGTAACPPYHIAVVIGGTSADACLKAVKLASAKYYDALPDRGERIRPGVPRSGTGAETARRSVQAGDRRAVRRKVLRPRRPGHPPPPPWRLMPARNGGVLLGRPQRQGEDHPGRHLHRGTGPQSRSPHTRRISRQAGARCQHRPQPADEGHPGRALQAPGLDSASAQRHHHRRPRHRAREVQGAHRRRQAGTGVPAQPSDLLRRSGQDAEREGVRLLRSNDGRPDGFLCGSAAEQGRQHDHDRQGQPLASR